MFHDPRPIHSSTVFTITPFTTLILTCLRRPPFTFTGVTKKRVTWLKSGVRVGRIEWPGTSPYDVPIHSDSACLWTRFSLSSVPRGLGSVSGLPDTSLVRTRPSVILTPPPCPVEDLGLRYVPVSESSRLVTRPLLLFWPPTHPVHPHPPSPTTRRFGRTPYSFFS